MRTLTVHAKPSSSHDAVETKAEDEFIVRTTAPPIQGRANRAIIELLAEHLGVAPSALIITRGRTSRIKTIAIQ